jgi:threonyl-tRNA synthetase
MIYRSQPRSYRDLPLRYAEYGTVYRYELSGTLAGLLRVRGFTQNDAHIYCTEAQVQEEFLNVMKLHEFWYKKVFGINDFYMRLSLPSKDKKKYAGMPQGWKKATALLKNIMEKSGLPFVEVQGEAAFYGPKVDFQIKSVIGREETASTNQLDFLATQRFQLTYKNQEGKDSPVYVIHRAPLGSHERFIAFLIEHYAGAFPLWLAPEQIWILPVSDKFIPFALKVQEKLLEKDNNLRIKVKEESETLGKKIREGEIQKIPYLLIVGEKEQAQGTLSVRQRGKGDTGQMRLEQFLAKIQQEIEEKSA